MIKRFDWTTYTVEAFAIAGGEATVDFLCRDDDMCDWAVVLQSETGARTLAGVITELADHSASHARDHKLDSPMISVEYRTADGSWLAA